MNRLSIKSILAVLGMTVILAGLLFTVPAHAELVEEEPGFINVDTKKDFEKALKMTGVRRIDVDATSWDEMVIPDGVYSDLMVRVYTEKKELKITVHEGTYLDHLNVMYWNGRHYYINNYGRIGTIGLLCSSTIDITDNGGIRRVLDLTGSTINLTGKSDVITEFETDGSDVTATFSTKKPVTVKIYGPLNAVFNKGAEDSTIEVFAPEKKVDVDNKTTKSIVLYDYANKKHTVKSNSKKTFMNEIPKASPDDIHKEKWDSYSSKLLYYGLTDNEKKFYDEVVAILDGYLYGLDEFWGDTTKYSDGTFRKSIRVLVPDYLTAEEAMNVLHIVDTSKYYFITNIHDVFYLIGKERQNGFVFEADGSFSNGNIRMSKTIEVEKQMEEWIADVKANGKTDKERLTYLHDKLCDVATPVQKKYGYEAVSLFAGTTELDREGYARTFSVIANGIGIDSAVVECANKCLVRVCLNGEWKYVDVYADDQAYEQLGYRVYDSFLIDVFTQPSYVFREYKGSHTDDNIIYRYVSYEKMFDLDKLLPLKEAAELEAKKQEIRATHEFKALGDCADNTIYLKLNANEKKFYKSLNKTLKEYLTKKVDYHGGHYDHSSYDGKTYGDEYYIITIEKPNYVTAEEFRRVAQTFDWSRYYFVHGFTIGSYLVNGKRVSNELKISMYSKFRNGKERAKVTEEMQSLVNDWVTDIMAQADTDEERIKLLHDRICEITDPEPEYIKKYATYVSGNYGGSIYGVLHGQTAATSGYAGTFSVIANALGIRTLYVSNAPIYWNTVKLGKKWYLVDTMRDDKSEGISYDCYLIADSTYRKKTGLYAAYYDYAADKNVSLSKLVPECKKAYKKK